jgi:hypothetical protein
MEIHFPCNCFGWSSWTLDKNMQSHLYIEKGYLFFFGGFKVSQKKVPLVAVLVPKESP